MPKVCRFTGKKSKSGNNRSHSMRATKRKFQPNLLKKKVMMEDGSIITVKISAKAYKKMKGFIG